MEVKGIGKVAFVWGRLGEGSDFKGGYGLAKILRKHGEASVRSIPEVLTRGERDFTHPNRLVFVHDGYRATVTHGGDGGAGHWVLSNYRRDE